MRLSSLNIELHVLVEPFPLLRLLPYLWLSRGEWLLSRRGLSKIGLSEARLSLSFILY